MCREQGKAPKACWRKVRRLDTAIGASSSFSLKWVFRGSLYIVAYPLLLYCIYAYLSSNIWRAALVRVYRLYILAAMHLNLTVALLHRVCLSFVYDYRRNTKDRQIARPLLYAVDFYRIQYH